MKNLERALNIFDDYNRQDPRDLTWQGELYPFEYFYALQLYNWVTKLKPAASEALLLASRSQHIGRWKSPRESYPEGKVGYLNWRADLKKFHAETAQSLLQEAGYDEPAIKDVQRIILKQQIKTDAEVQTMENALCLVFLEFQYEDFLNSHDDEKMIRILKKSWSKMDEAGQQAVASLQFSARGQELIDRALGK